MLYLLGRIFFSRVNFQCWLVLGYPFQARNNKVARERLRSFCQKCRWKVTNKHTCTLVPRKEVGVGRLCCPGIVYEPIKKRAHAQLVRERSSTVVSSLWATVDWTWPNKRVKLVSAADLHHTYTESIGMKGIVELSTKMLACEEESHTKHVLRSLGPFMKRKKAIFGKYAFHGK